MYNFFFVFSHSLEILDFSRFDDPFFPQHPFCSLTFCNEKKNIQLIVMNIKSTGTKKKQENESLKYDIVKIVYKFSPFQEFFISLSPCMHKKLA